jgi:enoyl-CoA hydratase/carnithine racemase
MSFASREKAIISQWEVGVGMVAGGGPMARLPRLIGRNRALEVLLSSEDIRADQAEAYGYVNRALPDADLDAFVEALATRIAGFDKWAIANSKRLLQSGLAPEFWRSFDTAAYFSLSCAKTPRQMEGTEDIRSPRRSSRLAALFQIIDPTPREDAETARKSLK